MADAVSTFPQISLGSRGGVAQGQLRVSPAGFQWRKAGGGKVVEIKREDIAGLYWMRISRDRGCQLGVRQAAGATLNFMGFKDKDLEPLSSYCRDTLSTPITTQELATSGRNWGSLAVNGSSLMFLVDSKVMMEVPLPDVNQAQQQKDEVVLEFHVDDTTGANEDVLVDLSFHVPPANKDWAPGEGAPGDENAAKALVAALLPLTDAESAASESSVVEFEDVHVLAPRGRMVVDMHASYFRMSGQTNDYKVRYASILRLWILPKSATPHTLVVVSLDPPIRKGQTYYSHLLCQFGSGEEVGKELAISDELLAAKNEKCGNKLIRDMEGPTYEVFARCLAGLSAAKISRASTAVYANASGDGCDIRCSYKADDGLLYPLKHSFVYVHKPPLLIQHTDIEHVDFQRQGGGVVSSSVRTFDLGIKMLGSTQEFQFRNINRAEWQHLFDFIVEKKIKIKNYAAAQQGPMGPGGAGAGLDIFEGEMDAGMRAAAAEAESDDEDFEGGSDPGSSSDGGSGSDDDGDGSASGSSDAELVDEEGIAVADIGMGAGGSKGSKKRKAEGGGEAAPKKQAKPRKPKAAAAAGGEDGEGAAAGPPAKKPRKKKDPNAPKKALSAFMYFSNKNRERVKTTNPGVAFGQIGKLLGEEWKTLTDEDKAPYAALAAQDKQRYAEAMAAYKGAAGGGGGGDAEEEVGEEDAEEIEGGSQ